MQLARLRVESKSEPILNIYIMEISNFAANCRVKTVNRYGLIEARGAPTTQPLEPQLRVGYFNIRRGSPVEIRRFSQRPFHFGDGRILNCLRLQGR
jgi:hypothetical protein